MRLANKIGIVTAAASGMGRAGAIRFAREGASVSRSRYRRAAVEAVVAEIDAAGGKAKGIVADLTKDADSRRIVGETAKHFGGLDFVWNHVGHPGPAAIEGLDMADYDLAMNLNLRSVLVTTEAALPELRARGGGSLALHGIDVGPARLAVQPGLLGRQARRRRLCARARQALCQGEDPRQRHLPRSHRHADAARVRGAARSAIDARRGQGGAGALARRPDPHGPPRQAEEVANAALFLISDEASFVTGAALAVDGGATA